MVGHEKRIRSQRETREEWWIKNREMWEDEEDLEKEGWTCWWWWQGRIDRVLLQDLNEPGRRVEKWWIDTLRFQRNFLNLEFVKMVVIESQVSVCSREKKLLWKLEKSKRLKSEDPLRRLMCLVKSYRRGWGWKSAACRRGSGGDAAPYRLGYSPALLQGTCAPRHKPTLQAFLLLLCLAFFLPCILHFYMLDAPLSVQLIYLVHTANTQAPHWRR